MSNTVTNLIEATSLALGRNLDLTWIDLAAEMLYDPESGPNDSSNIGVSVTSAVSAYVLLSPRFKQGAKSAMYVINRATYDDAANYVATVNGTAYTATAQGSVAATIQYFVDEITADIVDDYDARAVAVSSQNDGNIDAVYVYAIEDFTTPADPVLTCDISTTHADGTDETTGGFWGYVDPESFSARVWLKMTTPATFPLTMPWFSPADGDIGAIPDEGYAARLNVAAFERLYVEAYSVTKFGGDGADMIGRPFIALGPAILEED